MKEHPTPSWYKQLEQTPWGPPRLSIESMNKLADRANGKVTRGKWRIRELSWIGVGAAVVLLFIIFGLSNHSPEQTADLPPTTPPLPTNIVHMTYPSASWKDGIKIFEAFPGGDTESGRANGCWWNIYIPFEELKGSKLRVDAVHKQTGMKFSEIPEVELAAPTLAYNDFTRISSRFDVPYGGVWEYTLYLNDSKLGEVGFDIPEGSWQASSTFPYDSYTLTGVKGRLGFLNVGLGAGLPKNKFMWYFWGRDDAETRSLFAKKLSIIGTLKGSRTSLTIFEGSIGTPNPNVKPPIPDNDKRAMSPAMMTLPTAGIWRLDAIIDDKWFGSIFVEVK
ncbi:MAG: hypothetical protein K0Q81_1546 [Paenibacillus sp.]|nr:hypothetical protein [Paenibacillus sp.]